MNELKKLLENAGVTETDAFGGKGSYWDKKRGKGEGYVKYKDGEQHNSEMTEAQVLRNSMRSIATQIVHWASTSKYHDENESPKLMMNELHSLLKDKESIR